MTDKCRQHRFQISVIEVFSNKLLRLFLQKIQARDWGLSTSSLLPHSLLTQFRKRVTFWWTQTSKNSSCFVSHSSHLGSPPSQHPKDSTTPQPSAERGQGHGPKRATLHRVHHISIQALHRTGNKHCCFSPAQTLPAFLLAEATPSTNIRRSPEINIEWK